MKRKLMAFCTVIVAVSVVFTVSGAGLLKTKTGQDVSYAQRSQYYNEADDMNTTMNVDADVETTKGVSTPVDGFVDSKVDGFSAVGDLFGSVLGGGDSGSGLGDLFGGAGDMIGGVLGGNSEETAPTNNNVVTYPVDNNIGGYIDPVPAATQDSEQNQVTVSEKADSDLPSVGEATSGTTQSVSRNNNVTSNPYTKPVNTINPGDSGEGVKWIQWIFYYTGYGLEEKDITGEYDEKTQELVEKLQKEKGLTDDGVVNDSVIDKIELLYYEHMVTDTTASAGMITLPGTTLVTGDGSSTEKDTSAPLVIAIIAAIWCVVIIAVLVIIILKKKKKAKKSDADTQQQAPKKEDKKDTTVKSLSDLFEEANK